MCDFSKGFILCTCVDKTNTAEDAEDFWAASEKPYTWYLLRGAAPTKSIVIGQLEGPDDNIGSGLTSNWVLSNLNARHCFDFEYAPSEGDLLQIHMNSSSMYLSYVFAAGEWVKEDSFGAYTTKFELKQKGTLQAAE